MGTNTKEAFPESKEFLDRTEELNGTLFDENGKQMTAEPLEDALLADPDDCGLCGNTLVVPRMLHCLHVFCEACIDKKLSGEGGDAGTVDTSITCPTCTYVSKVGIKKMAALPLDVTKTNISDVSNISNLYCTSCTAKEVAKSRCSTCHNLLCNNCDSAHHYMRCFESHKVVALDELRKNGDKITVHKPLTCDFHKDENVNFYCLQCQKTVCPECTKHEHQGHHCENILDWEVRVRQEMELLMTKSKETVDVLVKSLNGLSNGLEELAHQRCSAKDLINETCQSYKAIVEKCRDNALEELSRLYRERELKIMKENDEVGKSIEHFEDACKFTLLLMETGTVSEMMYLRRLLQQRLQELNDSRPMLSAAFNIEFRSDFDKFEAMVREFFGKFSTETADEDDDDDEEDEQEDAEEEGEREEERQQYRHRSSASPGLSDFGALALTNGNGHASLNSSPFEGDVAAINHHMQNFNMAQSPPPLSQVTSSALQHLAGYNINQLATMTESVGSAATSPTPQFILADLLANDNACRNLASLAKLGLGGGTGTNAASSAVGGQSSAVAVQSAAAAAAAAAATVTRSNKVSPMQIRCKFGQLGPSKGQFNSPHGFCLGLEEDIIVADTNNHRIQVFEKTGSFKFQFGIPGKDEGQLWYPRKVAVMRPTGKYVVCDRGNERSRMQIFTKNGHFVKKIAIRYIDIVAGLAVSSRGEIVAVDSVSPTVFIIGESGDLLRWFDCSDYMREPSDIAIHGKEFYVCDFKGHNVVVFSEEGHFLRRIGCENLTNFPNGIDISDAGDVLIGDSHGNRFHVAVFSRDGSLISEFECPYVKVSRCCGLKITSEGYVVTLAKNNHHVLVLNTLYIL
ncbi:unnamed protein product [Brassicogethes aeneus]|uniref:Brain tumor protein n=1 Tax=Brassicogethes aeneus TaxID=1431903 RepID=A0A9P0FLH7_BRAAE|nr:unnamed protein product [Brassicogethes aeneus]